MLDVEVALEVELEGEVELAVLLERAGDAGGTGTCANCRCCGWVLVCWVCLGVLGYDSHANPS